MADESDPICRKTSTRCFNVCLKSTEQIYLVFLIPIIINCSVYIISFSADLVVTTQHFKEDNPIWGGATIAIMYAPALMYFILTISRPDWWMTDNDKISKGMLLWFFLQLCQLFAFPFFALYRYAGLIVLTTDAIILSGEERRKTLNMAAAPAAIELYFFLQAWFQAAPQAMLQSYILFTTSFTHRTYQSIAVQMLSIIMSIVTLAIQTTAFQRFESQRVNGRKLPWAMWLKKYCLEELNAHMEKSLLHSTNTIERNTLVASNSIEIRDEVEKVTESDNEKKEDTDSRAPLNRQESVTPPLPPKNAQITPPPMPLRGITTVHLLPVPDVPAPPRPDSIDVDTIFPETGSALPKSVSVISSEAALSKDADSLIIPKRKYSSKGLKEDDPVGKFLSFLWWFCFILSRILTITIFYSFYPIYLGGALSIHYVFMLAYLFYYAKYYDVITFFVNLWLGLIYIICIIEYRIKFKYADKWLFTYYTFVILQNAALTLTWYFAADYDGFWYNYVFCAIFISMILSVMSSAVYHMLLKPKKLRVNVD